MKKTAIMAILGSAALTANAAAPLDWKVPNWGTIVTASGSVKEWIGKTWSGHCQGMCVSSNAIYFSFHDQILKTDWYGRLLKWTEVDQHGGDICIWDGKLYTGIWLKPKKGSGDKWSGAIGVYDAETLEHLEMRAIKDWDNGVDGITALDGVIYLAMGSTGRYDPATKSGRKNWYGKFKAETLEQIGEPFCIDDGEDSLCGSQNMTTDGKYIYSSHYTDDEAAKTPNVVVHDKDTFKVVTKYRFGHNNGIDVVPGGKDGAVRFAWAFTPNWTNWKKEPPIPIQGIIQFVEVKGGEVSDLTVYGGGYRKFIER